MKPINDKEPADVQVGDHVRYVDPEGNERQALVTHAPGPGQSIAGPTINLVVVSNDPDEADSYGRQVKRPTSVSHRMNTEVDGRYWTLPGNDDA